MRKLLQLNPDPNPIQFQQNNSESRRRGSSIRWEMRGGRRRGEEAAAAISRSDCEKTAQPSFCQELAKKLVFGFLSPAARQFLLVGFGVCARERFSLEEQLTIASAI